MREGVTKNEKRIVRACAAITVLLSFFVAPFSLCAQSLPVFRTDTDVVVVPVTVTDRSGRFVSDLTAADFEISDDGDRRPLAQFSTERVPVSLGILLDISGSMATDAKARAIDDARWADTRRALELLVQRLNPRDEVFFAAFADKVRLAVPWTHDLQQVPRAFDTLRPGGYTAMFDAVKLIAPAFQRAEHARRVLLVVSDGRDSLVPRISGGLPPVSRPTTRIEQVQIEIQSRQRALRDTAVGAAQRAVHTSDAALYAIGMGTGKGAYVDVANLESLTADSGGYVEAINEPSEISAAVARIFDELQSQYLLAFEPARADGKQHLISVTTRNRDLRVRARGGYTAAERK
jgi:Ca-activated chloride channel family protein